MLPCPYHSIKATDKFFKNLSSQQVIKLEVLLLLFYKWSFFLRKETHMERGFLQTFILYISTCSAVLLQGCKGRNTRQVTALVAGSPSSGLVDMAEG